MATNYIFVTGGVVSSLGKGIAAASLAAILEARGLNVTIMKLDPYINVDPGTTTRQFKMSAWNCIKKSFLEAPPSTFSSFNLIPVVISVKKQKI